MTDNTASNPTQPTSTHTKNPRRRRGLKWLLIGAPAIAFAGMFFAKHRTAWAEDGGCRGHFGMSEEKMDAFFEHRLEFVFHAIDATPEQQEKIRAIVDSAKPEVKRLREERRALKAKIKTALTAPTVKADELELLRQEALGMAGNGSELLTQNLVKISQVLTLEQRKKIADFMARRFGH
ncbi:MAG: Spy/CpxP family protein refolding chaperone [Polyangiaceae bacterium]|nr:Spy/CpxP family protein refolding chaperone [Polyangiaceae bacterium]